MDYAVQQHSEEDTRIHGQNKIKLKRHDKCHNTQCYPSQTCNGIPVLNLRIIVRMLGHYVWCPITYSNFYIKNLIINNIYLRVVKGGSRSRFTENKTVLSQFTKNKIGISRFTEKRRTFFFKQKLHTVSFWKITSKAKPCLLFSLSVHFAFCAMQKGNRVPRSAYHNWHHLFLKISKSPAVA